MPAEDVLSLQLYSLRNHGDTAAQLDLARAAGFAKVETFGPYYADPASTRAMLDEYGLAAPSGHFPLPAFIERLDETLRIAGVLGIRHLVMPAVPDTDRGMNADGWRSLGARLGEIARRLEGDGLVFAYHNHDWEMAIEDGATMLDRLFEGAGGAPLKWQADIAWLVRGGADPEATIMRHRDRLVSAHVKDIARSGENADEDGWADVGHGTLDWRRLWRVCREAGAQLMVVEHDKPKDAARFVRRSHAFLAPFAA